MRILNIGFDKTLVGLPGPGDAIKRHKEYAEHLGSLDIIVYTKPGEATGPYIISDKVRGHPTSSKSRVRFIFDAVRLAELVYDKRPFDIVVSQDPLGAGLAGYLVKRKTGCKLQVNFHGDYWDNDYWKSRGFLYRVLLVLSKYIVKQADGIRVVSEGIKKKLLKAGVANRKIVVLPTPVNFEDFSSPDQKQTEEVMREFTGRSMVLHAGRHTEEKNLESLLRILPQVKSKVSDVVFVLAGEGLLTSELKSLAKEQNLQDDVVFTGLLSPERLACYMAACDVLVLPSLTESLGKVLIEAALAGKPVVASATTGAQEIVEDGKTGYVTPVGDMMSFSDRLSELLLDKGKQKEMGGAARDHVRKKFDREKVVSGIIDFWKKLADEA